jgi:23S rRNA (pseudouridine1915-N3)-methyltransferase
MIRVIAIGKLKDRRLSEWVAEYSRRIAGMVPFTRIELRDATPEREAQAMLGQLGSANGHELVLALDERGEELTSRNLADLLGRHGSVAFLIGGPDGLGDAARRRADRTVRLSAMTFPHELANVILVEQIYRALTILQHRPYHRD